MHSDSSSAEPLGTPGLSTFLASGEGGATPLTGLYGEEIESWCSRLRQWGKPAYVALCVAVSDSLAGREANPKASCLNLARAWLGTSTEENRLAAFKVEASCALHEVELLAKDVRPSAEAAVYAALAAGAKSAFPPEAAFLAPEKWIEEGEFTAFDGAMCALTIAGDMGHLERPPEGLLRDLLGNLTPTSEP